MDAVNKKIICKHGHQWECPPKIDLGHSWAVATGEESEEKQVQESREKIMPEEVYRGLSCIPSNPYRPWDVQEDHLDESTIPLIPMISIEEVEPPVGNEEVEPPVGNVTSSPGEPVVEVGSITLADAVLAAATAAKALLESKDLESVDIAMLVKIFSDAETVERLIKSRFGSAASSSSDASSSSRINPVLESKLLGTSTPLSSSNDGTYEEVCTNHGVLSKSVKKSSPNPDTAPRIPLPSMPNSEPDLDGYKWTDTGCGGCTKRDIQPISSPNLVTPDVAIPTLNENLAFPTRLNMSPLPKERQIDLQLKAVLSDSIRPTASRLIPESPGVSRVNPFLFSNHVQPSLQLNLFLNQGRVNSQIRAPFQYMAQPGLGMNGPLPNQRSPGLEIRESFPYQADPGLGMNAPFQKQSAPSIQMTGLSTANQQPPCFLPNTSPQLLDRNYIKSLIQEHGKNSAMYASQQYNKPYTDCVLLEAKIQQACFFFNSPDGCTHGNSCPYIHAVVHMGIVVHTSMIALKTCSLVPHRVLKE